MVFHFRSAPASPTHGMMMPPPFVPVRTPEESRSPRQIPVDNVDSPKQKMPKPTAVLAKAKSPTDNKQATPAIAFGDKPSLGPKSIIISQPQSFKPAVVSVIRPQTAAAASTTHNGFAKVEAQHIISANSASPLLDRKHVITNPKLEIERIQSSYNGKNKTVINFG